MNHPIDLDGLTKAARRREFDDGLMDYATGSIFLVYCSLAWFFFSPAGFKWYVMAITNFRTITIIGLVGLEVLLIAGMISVRKIIEYIRKSKIWKNKGFIKPLYLQASWPVILLSVAVDLGMILYASWLMAVGSIDLETVLRTVVAATGISTGIIYLGISVFLDLRRYLIVGLLGGLISGLILLLPVSFSIAWLIFGITWTLLFVGSGTWALNRLLSVNKESSYD